MSALGSLVVKLALEHAEFTKGINQSDQAALKFAKNTQNKFDQIDRKTKQFFSNFAAGALGTVASITGITGAVTKFNQSIDKLADLSALNQRTGIAVERLSQLDRVIQDTGGSMENTVARIERMAQGMARVPGPSNLVLNALDAVNVQTRNLDGTLRDSGDVFVDLSKRLAEFEDGASKTALVMDIFGRSGAQLLPVMNNVAARIDDTAVSSTEAALQAEAYNNAMGTLGRRFDDIFTTVASHLLPSLLNITEAMSMSGQATSGFSKAGAVLSEVLKGLAVSAVTIGGTFKLLGEQIGGRAAQLVALSKLDFTGAAQIGDELSKSMVRIRDEVGDTIDTILGADQEIAEAIERTGRKQLEFTSGAVDGTDRLASALEKSNRAAKKEVDTLAARGRALTLSLDPLARYNSEVEELVQLLGAGAISQRIFDLELNNAKARFDEATGAVEKVNDKLVETKDTAQRVFDDVSQFAVQGARNIQTALSDALLDGINGFHNFADSALNIIKRLAANIASVKILEGLGVGGLLGAGSSSASSPGGGFSLLDGASLLSSAGNLISGGFGSTAAFGSAIQAGGTFFGSGSTAAFGAVLGGDSIGGVIAGTEAGLSGSAVASAASAGAAAASAVGTLGAAAVGTFIGKAIAGDKEVFGVNGTVTSSAGAAVGAAVGSIVPGVGTAIGAAVGAVLGGTINRLFGLGPLEKGRTLFRGNITEEGIADDFLTSTTFTAKGGVFRSNKNDRVINSAVDGRLINGAPGLPESGIDSSLLPFAEEAGKRAIEVGEFFTGAVKQFDASLRQTGETLGIGSDQLDNFQRWIHLVSDEAGEISSEQIAAEIQNIGDHMANVLLPGLQDMRRGNETALDALTRIVQETKSLENVLVVLGVSSVDAEEAIKGLSISARTDLVDAAGGLEPLAQKVGFFASNFLTLEEQTELLFNSVDKELKKLGFSADLTRQEFADLVKSVTQAGGVTAETSIALLNLAPAFIELKNSEEQLEAQTIQTTSSTDTLKNSVQDLGETAEEAAARIAATVQQSFADIDSLRENVASAMGDLAIANARERVSQEQVNLNNASANLTEAKSDLEAAKNAAQQSSINAINETIAQRNVLIGTYEEEASALKSVVDRFGALSDKILEFNDSLAISNLSPFSPGEQLAIARQQFNTTRNLAAQGDENALARLPEVSEAFLEASQIFNGATGAFESDFNFVQQVLESSGATARATRDIAQSQLDGIEGTISQLKGLNEAEERNLEKFTSINTGVMSVAQATQNLARRQAEFNGAKYNYDTATDKLDDAIRSNGGFITGVEEATDRVDKSVRALAEAVLQGFGNAFIADQAIRDYVIANPNLTDRQYLQAAVENNISGNQLERALKPFNVSRERINQAAQGASVRGEDINNAVNSLLAVGDFMGIYRLAKANGVNTDQLVNNSVLSKEEVNAFYRANNLKPLATGTDFVPRDGIAMLHKGEAVVPSSTTQEIKALRQELAQLRREQNQQMSALINTNIQANKESAQTIAKSNEKLAANGPWQNRVRAQIR